MKDYDESIKNIKKFLDGDLENVIESLTSKMKNLASKLEFEEA
jgi:excinuclease UvrABC nuclease subunit